jgi:UDP-N-acetylmuramoylalanine--D-glutamate ligase
MQAMMDISVPCDRAAPRTLIVGLGKTGLSCARFLAARGVRAAITDSRENPPGLARLREELPDTALFLGGFQAAAFAACEQLIVSPGVALSEPLIQATRQRGVPVLGDIDLFAQMAAAPVLAVTGSNGKSTVVSLLGEMARCAGWRAAVGGNLGEPALDLLAAEQQLYILELSSFQLESSHCLRPQAATVLNISPDHMDRYADLESYARAKARIYQGAAIGVVNRDDARAAGLAGGSVEQRGFTVGAPGEGDYGLRQHTGEIWLARAEQCLLPAAQLALKGMHNLSNALAALALGEAVGLALPAMLRGLRQFRGLAHRTQWLRERRGVHWYNDSKGTNVGATLAALQGLRPVHRGQAVLIAGGDGKGADFSALAPVVAETCKALVLIGRDAPLLRAALAASAPVTLAASLREAVSLSAQAAAPGDFVLLSPACASFDMFDGFEHRGDVFMELVAGLPA